MGLLLVACDGLLLVACDGEPNPIDAGLDADLADAAPPPPPTAITTLGPVVGRSSGGVAAFLGIPYAAPPVGDLRWRPPQPPEAWSEPLATTGRPPRCIQKALGLDLPSQEDCLYLNVHTPDPRPEGAPVMVWIHGGAFLFGEGLQTDEGTAGDVLAREHGVVVVSMNYRLGPFGFLAHPALSAEEGTSGNYGLMDQRAALEWVRDNIAAFGGDPANVTLFGESAGGMSVCAHLVSPASAGLFRRAISESGLCDSPTDTLATQETGGVAFADTLGCSTASDIASCLRAKTSDEVTAADAAGMDVFRELNAERAWWPIVDGLVLPGDFRTQVEAGAFERVPTIVGWNGNEGTLFVLLAEQGGAVIDAAAYDEVMRGLAANYRLAVDDLFGQYPIAGYPDPGAALAAAIGDGTLACPSRRAARLLADAGADVRVYHFTYPDASFQLPADRELGAFHSAEVQFVFGHPSMIGRRMFAGDELALHDAMSGYWTRFAAGDPNGGGAPLWPAYDSAGDAHLVLDRTIEAGTGASVDECALWEPVP